MIKLINKEDIHISMIKGIYLQLLWVRDQLEDIQLVSEKLK